MNRFRSLLTEYKDSVYSGIIVSLVGVIIMMGMGMHDLATDRNAVMASSEGWESAYGSILLKINMSDLNKELNERFIVDFVDNNVKLISRFEALKKMDPWMDDFKVKQGLFYIHKYAPKYGLDLDTAITIAYMESRFDEHAISHTNDYGMMQVNLAIWGPVFGLTTDDLFDVETNVNTGLKILKIKLERYGKERYVEKYNGSPVYAVRFAKTFIKYQSKMQFY